MVKLTKQLEYRVKKALESKGCTDFDIVAMWDAKLTLKENCKNILGTDDVKLIKYNKKEEDETRKKVLEQELKRKQELEAKSLEEIKKSITPSIATYYATLKDFVVLIAKGYSNSLILVGKTAIGKTWNTLKALDELKIKYVYHSGFTTPLALYKFLYEHRDDFVIFFDDTVGISSSDEALSIMLPALWSTTDNRTVRWSSTSGKLGDVPTTFSLNSRIIFCINEIPESSKMKAIVSRCQKYELAFTYKQAIQIMYEIAKTPNSNLTKKDRFTIVDFISENTDTSTKDLNLRTQKKIEEIYLYCREHKMKWQRLALELIKDKNDAIIKVKSLMESGSSVDKQISEFTKSTGMSRATFFRYRKRLRKENDNNA